jgi:hypothetical protein
MEDNTGGCKTLLPGRNEYACHVRKRTDQRTPAQGPPKKHANEIPRSELSRNYRRKIGGGDGRDGNDSDDERDKKGQSSRTHMGEVRGGRAPMELEMERLSLSDLDYAFPEHSGNASYLLTTTEYDESGNQNPYLNPWADEGDQIPTPPEATQPNQVKGSRCKGKQKESRRTISSASASNSTSSSILPRNSTSARLSSESHISSIPEGNEAEARGVYKDHSGPAKSNENEDEDAVPITVPINNEKNILRQERWSRWWKR